MSSTQSFQTPVFEMTSRKTDWESTAFDIKPYFPNATAIPVQIDVYAAVWRGSGSSSYKTCYGGVLLNGNWLCEQNTTSTSGVETYQSFTTASIIGKARDAASLSVFGHSTSTKITAHSVAGLMLYFTRYDFSATAGSGVTSASVSSSTGYGGAGITFSCVIPTGYVFDGWYSGTTLVSSSQSYTYTIPTDNAANYDLALTAKAHQNTHNVNGSYYFGTDTSPSTKAILTGITGNVGVSYNNGSKNCTTTLNTTNNFFELACGGKVAANNINVGSASLQCGGKLMRSNLKLNYV